MSENYKIILDEDKLKRFIEFLPELQESEKYYLTLIGRKKYLKENNIVFSTDKCQIKRFLATKKNLFNKLQQLEVKLGVWQIDGVKIPQEALTVYISPNPRNLWLANLRGISALAKAIEDNKKNVNPHQEMLSQIHKTATNKRYITFDLDVKDKSVLYQCVELVEGYVDVLETRGGFHLLVQRENVDKIKNKFWYPELKKFCDVTGDELCVLAGVTQGGFMPRIVMKNGSIDGCDEFSVDKE